MSVGGRASSRAVLLSTLLCCVVATAGDTAPHKKVCIAEGVASAPYNSLAGFKLALSSHPDFIETDLQLSKDGVLVCIHDPFLEGVTDVEKVFPYRFATIERDGKSTRTWYVNDFTLDELRKLDIGSSFDAAFKGERLPTFQELIDLVRGKAGLYPELKDPDFYRARGLDIAKALNDLLAHNGLATRDGQKDTPIVVQSFDAAILKEMRQLGGRNYTLIQLVWFSQWSDYMSNEGLDRVAAYADGIGPVLSLVLPPETSRIYEAHKRGLQVHAWTAHEAMPPARFKSVTEYEAYLLSELGVDGLFTTRPDLFPRL